MKKEIFQTSASDTVTLFFDPPEDRQPMECFDLYLNGTLHCRTEKTHAEFTGLLPETGYDFSVVFRNETIYTIHALTKPLRKRIDIREYGAAGDEVTMNTAAIQKAIDACGQDEEIVIPSGVFRTGALRLHSNMSLYLEEGAVLLGTENPEDYLPWIPSRFEGTEMECYSSLLNLGTLDRTKITCENVLIHGKGTIESGGRQLAVNIIESERERMKEYLSAHAELVASCENEDTLPGRVRPRLINLSSCRNVRISGLTLKNGASWNVHMIYSENIITDHCTFISEGVWNGDGWDPDSSKDCSIFACTFYTGDDSVAVKSGKNPEGNAINRPCRNIRVFDCTCRTGHGIAIGSEISGGIEGIRIYDCDLRNSAFGILIKGTRKRGGYVRDITVRDTSLPSVLVRSVNYNDDGIPAPAPPVFEHFLFERLRISGEALSLEGNREPVNPIELSGFEGEGYELCDVIIKDSEIERSGGAVILQRCRNVKLDGLRRNNETV